MDQQAIFITILGMAAVTAVPRILPVWLLADRRLPAIVERWLKYVPVTVLSALLMPSILIPEGAIDLGFSNLYFWAALPTLWIGWKTRSLFGAVIAGMVLVALVRFFLGG
jgi:branched-subunit amino acid transport protein